MANMPSNLMSYAQMVEEELSRQMPEESDLFQKEVFSACRYSLLGGGKRLRPYLCMTFYELCSGRSASEALTFASGIEMIHSYSLIHDDLPCMDNSDYRRGKLSNHKVYGETTAVLAGDALLNRAFEVMSDPSQVIEPANVLRALHVMGIASGAYGMVGGQIIDLSMEGRSCTSEELWKMVELKTSALIWGACKSGACLAGASETLQEAAYQYGLCIGLAFQIRDDLLDLFGDAALVGKPVGSDAENDKNTFASIYGPEKCEELIRELTDKAMTYAEVFGTGAESLKNLALWLTDRAY